MKDKSYIIVANAERQVMTTNKHALKQPNFKPIVERRSYDYREGDLGMLHPSAIDFFRNFSPKKPSRNSGILSTVTAYERGNFLDTIGTGIDSDEFPVVMYDKEVRIGEGYIIVPLMQSEFVRLRGKSLDYIKKKIAGWEEKEDLIAACRQDGLDDWIEEQYRHLGAFETLMNGRYDQIPVERTKRKISDEKIKSETEFLSDLWRINYSVRTRIPKVRFVN